MNGEPSALMRLTPIWSVALRSSRWRWRVDQFNYSKYQPGSNHSEGQYPGGPVALHDVFLYLRSED